MARMTAERVQRLARRRPGALGTALLLPTWVGLGLVCVLYIVAVLVLAFAAVVVHTLRLFLRPPLTALGRVTGYLAWKERRRLDRYAREGVDQLERELAQERAE